jgi:hypothetical protein
MGHWCDGQASLVVGTHTHVPTGDAMILNKGTAYLTDAGMCGDYDSVIGMEKLEPLRRFITGMSSNRFEPAVGEATLSGVYVETDDRTGKATRIAMVRHPVAPVLAVGLHQPRHHLLHARRAMHWQGCAVTALHPALQHQLAQTVNVVRMKVSEKHRFYPPMGKTQAANVAAGTVACIKYQKTLPCHHQGAGAGAQLVRKGRTRPTHSHMQAIGQALQTGGGQVLGRDFEGHLQGDLCAPVVNGRSGEEEHQEGEAPRCAKGHGESLE